MSPPDSGFTSEAPSRTDGRYAAHTFVDGERCLTIAGLMRRWLAWEWALWTLFCGWLSWRAGLSLGWLPLLAPASWLLTRWGVFVAELVFALTANRFPPPGLRTEAQALADLAPAASPLALLGCITTEWRHWLFSFVLGQAFAGLGREASAAAFGMPAGTARRRVVLLVHGFGCHGGIWRHAAPRLAEAGWIVETIDLLPVFGPIDAYIARIDATVEQIHARHGVERIDAVGHSMGGVALRAWAARHGEARLARLVTVGSPHRGTWFAHLFISPNVKQMRLGNDFLATLATAEAANHASRHAAVPDAERACLWSWHDNVVTPQVSARLPGAHEWRAAGIGHLSLICEPHGIALIIEALRAGREAAPATASPSAGQAADRAGTAPR